MYLHKLILENFRNYQHEELIFDRNDGFTIFLGENGAGKTNILEALYLLGCTQSFRAPRKEQLIFNESPYFRIQGYATDDNGEECVMDIVFQKTPHKYQYTWNNIRMSAGGFIGRLPVVLFLPEDLALITDEPAKRRRFLDMLLSRVSRKYLEALVLYQKALAARNKLLVISHERPVEPEELAYFESELITHGTQMLTERVAAVAFINSRISDIYQEISQTGDIVQIHYTSTVPSTDMYRTLIERHGVHDKMRCQTSIGPHRDDFEFLINRKPVAHFLSRGEFRTAILALKLAEIAFVDEKKNEHPILLLDDVFSELDFSHRYGLLEKLNGYQIIITTVEPYYFKDFKGNYRLERVSRS